MNSYSVLLEMQAIGVKVQVGYGLTESSPVIAARRPTCNVRHVYFVFRFQPIFYIQLVHVIAFQQYKTFLIIQLSELLQQDINWK